MSLIGIVRSRVIARAVLRYSAIALALAALLVLPGCWVESINPLYEDGFLSSKDPDVVFDQNLIGSWIVVGDNCEAPVTITAKDDVYDLQSTERSEDEGCAESDKLSHDQARLVKLDNYYFLDLSPMAEEVCARCLAKHDIYLAKFDKSTLSITPIDSDWLKKALTAKKITLATLGDDPDTITASSRELKTFCRRFAGNKMVFKPESTTTFKRK
jgi:hypothetical protein